MAMDRRRWLQGVLAMTVAPVSLPAAGARTPSAPAVAGWPGPCVVPLWPDAVPGHEGYRDPPRRADEPPAFLRGIASPTLHVYRPAQPDGRAVLVCPGGAYRFVSIANEGVEVARAFNAAGITVCVLAYRLPGEGWLQRSDVPLQDAQRALRLIRHRAADWGVRRDAIGVMGFSAGGHLAATLATAWDEPVYAAVDVIDEVSARPDHAALLYPVITLTTPYTHAESRDQLLGVPASEALIHHRSPDEHVQPDTPRCFIAHAADDGAVPIENAERMTAALRRAGVGVEYHAFEHGEHAFGVGRPGTPSAAWPALYDAWSRG